MRRKINETLTDRSFGVEVEMYARKSMSAVAHAINNAGVECHDEGYNHTTRTYWKVVRDGSLQRCPAGHPYAMEIVSPVLRGAEGLAQIRKVCEVLNSSDIDAKVNITCGLHVHHGAEGFGMRQFRNIYNIYKNYESEIDELVAPSRRRDNAYFCKGFQHNSFERVWADNSADERYWKLNFASYYRHGTIEIRHFNGTTDADKMCGWVLFTQAIIERAATGRCHSKRANVFVGLQAYKWGAELRCVAEEEVNKMADVFRQMRNWVNERKRALVRASR